VSAQQKSFTTNTPTSPAFSAKLDLARTKTMVSLQQGIEPWPPASCSRGMTSRNTDHYTIEDVQPKLGTDVIDEESWSCTVYYSLSLDQDNPFDDIFMQFTIP
jgi:hypothetical protein